eukprot:Phypoly_transcript_15705.p1 GENE.Phypoly_transcript_15705~~Phypoly_transcript_15705.p1  ORF type:complete len:203 (+),score=20.23 Phypoly_transcript_15705:84-692(+)
MTLETYATVPQFLSAPHKSATVLLVGVDGSGKRTLFKFLKEKSEKNHILLEIRSINSLPLPDNADRQRMDFIIFLVDMTNKASFESTKKSIESHLHPDYLLGRSCLVATKADLMSSYAFAIKELETFQVDLNIPVIVQDASPTKPPQQGTDSSTKSSGELAADKIVRLIEIANHYVQPKVTPLLLHTLDLSMVASTMKPKLQ